MNFKVDPFNTNHRAVVDKCNWLENRGKYSRYDIGEEASVWVCNECECDPTEIDVDEETCECGGEL